MDSSLRPGREKDHSQARKMDGELMGDCTAPQCGHQKARTPSFTRRVSIVQGQPLRVGWRAETAPAHSTYMPEGQRHTLHPPLSPEVMAHVQLPAPIPDHSSAPGFSRFQGGEGVSQRLGPHPPAFVPT